MKALLKGGLCLALSWAAARSDAQETTAWRSAASSGTIPVSAVAQPAAVRPAVGLRAPVPLGDPAPLVRGQIPDERPLPTGPAVPGGTSFAPPRPIATGTTPVAPLPRAGDFTAPTPQLVGPMPSTSGVPATPGGPVLDSDRIWGTLPPGVCDGCGDCSGLACGDCCGTDCCFGTCCDPCCNNRCSGGLFWVSAEYLLWFQRTQSIPPLVTTSPLGTPLIASGVLGLPTTTSAFDHINNNPVSGGRFSAGFWFPRCNDWGIDASYFFLGKQNETHTFSTAQGGQISRPVTEVNSGNAIAELVSFPGILNGAVAVQDYNQVWGFDVNLRKRICCGCNYWLDLLGGYRHLDLSEGISVTENLNVLNADGSIGGNIQVFDSFRTVNRFNGGQFGVQGQWNFASRFFVGGTFKLAMGNVHQTVDINGSTTFSGFTAPGAINGTRPGGLLALPTNIGHFSGDRFGVLPEVGVRVGMDITQHLQAFVGYDFIYLSSVVRPGDQIDTVINRSQLPNVTVPGTPTLVGPARPTVLFRQTDWWAQGVSFGLRYHW